MVGLTQNGNTGPGVRWWQQPGERVLWEGGPDPGVVFSRRDALLVPFSLVWTGIAVSIFAGLVTISAGGAIFSAPFVATGLYLVAGRFFYKRYDRRRTRYAVTDRRAIEVRTDGRLLKDAPITSAPMRVQRRRDGRHGTIIWTLYDPYPNFGTPAFRGFGSPQLFRGDGWPASNRAGLPELAFVDVDDFDRLLATVNGLRSGALSPPPPPLADVPSVSPWPSPSTWPSPSSGPGTLQAPTDEPNWGRRLPPTLTAPLLVAGLVTAVLLGLFVVHRLTPYMNRPTFSVPGTTTTELARGTYVIFAHSLQGGRPINLCPVGDDCAPFGPSGVTVTGPDAVHPRVVADVTRDRITVDDAVTYPGVVEFQVAEAGRYRIVISSSRADTVLIDPSPGQELHAFIGWIVLGAVAVIVTVGSFVCLVDARRARRRTSPSFRGTPGAPWTGR